MNKLCVWLRGLFGRNISEVVQPRPVFIGKTTYEDECWRLHIRGDDWVFEKFGQDLHGQTGWHPHEGSKPILEILKSMVRDSHDPSLGRKCFWIGQYKGKDYRVTVTTRHVWTERQFEDVLGDPVWRMTYPVDEAFVLIAALMEKQCLGTQP